MENGHLGGIVRHLKSLLGAESARASTDGELLQRFAKQHDEAAFAALVERYAPLVLGVCRRTLQNDHDAEDVFQATFLVLLRKAGSLDGRGTIANWLYTVAYHLALKARARSGQRRAHERQVADMPDVETQTAPLWNELRPLLDEELDHLPDKYRSPMVLCYLTGKTNEQAARELGWTKDTVRGRLARAGSAPQPPRSPRRDADFDDPRRRPDRARRPSLRPRRLGRCHAKSRCPVRGRQHGRRRDLRLGPCPGPRGLEGSLLRQVQGRRRPVLDGRHRRHGRRSDGFRPERNSGRHRPKSSEWSTPRVKSHRRQPKPSPPSAPKYEPYEVEPVTNCPEDEMMDEAAEEQPEPPPSPSLPKVTIKRRDWACEGELQKQLLAVPEVSQADLGNWPKLAGNDERFVGGYRGMSSRRPRRPVVELLADHPLDLAGLPRAQDGDSQLAKGPAKDLAFLSRELRAILAEMLAPIRKQEPVEPHLVPLTLRKNLSDRTQTLSHDRAQTPIFQNPGAVATLMQMLTAEDSGIRLVLVEQLTGFSHPSATEALARLALFDLAPEVRAAAVQALAARPRAEYRAVLLAGFRYPWAPVADHAAEALLALEDRDAVPALKELARETDPAAASVPASAVREVVRINHLSNCVMCHASSQNKDDLVRGRIPVPGQPLPPLSEYYQSNEGIFVRADITYLRQDFSVKQPVVKAKDDPWPDRQRYDYLVRTRTLTPEEYGKRSRRPSSTFRRRREAVLIRLARTHIEIAHFRPPGRQDAPAVPRFMPTLLGAVALLLPGRFAAAKP